MASALDAYAAKIIKPSALNKPNFIILYGNPGSGKTHLAASISEVKEFGPTLIIDTENSTQGTVTGFSDANLDIIQVNTHDEFVEVFNAVLTAAEDGTLKYKSVIIDTLDVAQERAVEHFKRLEEAKPKPNDLAHWGEVKKWTEKIGRLLQEAPFLAIAVMHSKRDKQEDGPVMDTVALAGSAKDSFPGIPDIVGFTERENGVTTVSLGSSKRRSTKNRFGLDETITNPSMATILNAINNNKKEAK